MNKNGRYESYVEPRLEAIKAWRRHGMTMEEIADNLGVCRRTLFEYNQQHPELADALSRGKEDADAQVENALFKRACGYEVEEVETTIKKDGTAIVRKTRKQVPPDTVSMIFYLKNRKAKDWCDRTVKELAGTISISEQRKELAETPNDKLKEIVERELSTLNRLKDKVLVGSDPEPGKN